MHRRTRKCETAGAETVLGYVLSYVLDQDKFELAKHSINRYLLPRPFNVIQV